MTNSKIIIGELEYTSMEQLYDLLQDVHTLFNETDKEWENVPIEEDGLSFTNSNGKIKVLVWYED